jgi:hypothetical protein
MMSGQLITFFSAFLSFKLDIIIGLKLRALAASVSMKMTIPQHQEERRQHKDIFAFLV